VFSAYAPKGQCTKVHQNQPYTVTGVLGTSEIGLMMCLSVQLAYSAEGGSNSPAVDSVLPKVVSEAKHGPSSLILSSCHFAGWDSKNEGRPCIRADGGRLVVNGYDP
jgi:hypothetical protein